MKRLRNVVKHVRLVGGVLFSDLPIWTRALRGGPGAWRGARNREDVLEWSPDGTGVRIASPWSAPMHAARVVPGLGRALYRRALEEHPVELRAGRTEQGPGEAPEATVVVCHRGVQRLPHLRAVLASLAAQRDVPFECLVVEQSAQPEAVDALPPWVRYAHQPWPADSPFGRAHAFNFGAERATSELLILHDNDMLVPVDYVRRIADRAREGFEVVNVKRFIFYLSEDETNRFFSTGALSPTPTLDSVVQNSLGGGSVAVTRNALDAIGGFDEGFVGWGGEDVEFWERALSRNVFSWGCLPLVHLWHEPQPGRTSMSKDTPANRRAAERLEIPVAQRIDELRARKDDRRAGRC